MHVISSPVVLFPLYVGLMGVIPLLALSGVWRLSFFRWIWVSGFVTYAMMVLHVTLFPLRLDPERAGSLAALADAINLTPFASADSAQFALNVVMMVPFGFMLPLVATRLSSFRVVTIAGLAVSGAIEGAQALSVLLLGNRRVVDIDDLIANTAGAALGYLAFAATIGLALTLVREARRPVAGPVRHQAHSMLR